MSDKIPTEKKADEMLPKQNIHVPKSVHIGSSAIGEIVNVVNGDSSQLNINHLSFNITFQQLVYSTPPQSENGGQGGQRNVPEDDPEPKADPVTKGPNILSRSKRFLAGLANKAHREGRGGS